MIFNLPNKIAVHKNHKAYSLLKKKTALQKILSITKRSYVIPEVCERVHVDDLRVKLGGVLQQNHVTQPRRTHLFLSYNK